MSALPPLNWGVVVFPGTNCEIETVYVLKELLGQDARTVWHRETDLSEFDGLILAGGFAHGDYLRAGAVARFSPVMDSISRFAADGGAVVGICNGFQVLVEAGLLPGAMLHNRSRRFLSRWVNLRAEASSSPLLSGLTPGEVFRVPDAHGEGCFFADPDVLAEMTANGQIAFRYCGEDGAVTDTANPNGSLECIAGVTNAGGNVLALMPHPERAAEAVLGGDDGRRILESIIRGARPRLARAA